MKNQLVYKKNWKKYPGRWPRTNNFLKQIQYSVYTLLQGESLYSWLVLPSFFLCFLSPSLTPPSFISIFWFGITFLLYNYFFLKPPLPKKPTWLYLLIIFMAMVIRIVEIHLERCMAENLCRSISPRTERSGSFKSSTYVAGVSM